MPKRIRLSPSWPLVYFWTCLPVHQVYLSPCLHFTYLHVNLSICLSSYLSSCLLVYLLIYQTTKCLFFTFLPKIPKSLDLPLQKANKYCIFTKQVKYSIIRIGFSSPKKTSNFCTFCFVSLKLLKLKACPTTNRTLFFRKLNLNV